MRLALLRTLLGIDAAPVAQTCPRYAGGQGPLCAPCTEQIAARLPGPPVPMLGLPRPNKPRR